MRKLSVVLAVPMLVLVGSVACSGSPPKGSAPAGWVLTWKADFNGSYGSRPDPDDWKYQTGHGIFGNGQVETMTTNPANVRLNGHGNLEIIPVGHGDSWTSGRVKTKRLFAAPFRGELMVTASIKQPDPADGLGYWPAFWMLGQGAWPEHGEIDIMEDVDAFSEHSGTLHCGNLDTRNPDGTLGPCHEYGGLSSGLQPCAGCQTGYHTYTVVIDRRDPGHEQVRWYLDGRQFFSVNESRVGASAWTEAVDNKFSIILDVAIGGADPDAICRCSTPDFATTADGTMSIRFLAVYEKFPTSS
jgi:beta-glucanase (GH16 family)